jgi:hypothetical protein
MPPVVNALHVTVAGMARDTRRLMPAKADSVRL